MTFNVGLSSDLSNGGDGFSWGEISIETLAPLPWKFLPAAEKNFRPEIFSGVDAVAFAGPGVDQDSFGSPEESPLIIARFGVGYDNIDLDSCTRAGVALTITPDGSQKPVATAGLMMLLSTMHRLSAKDHLARRHGWSERLHGLGSGVNGKTIGTIGLGNIATEFFRLLAPFETRRIAFDPWKTQAEADLHNVTLVDLDTLLRESDAIVVMAVLTPDTFHLLNAERLATMKKSAYVINVSRGPIIDESALITALQNGVIAGAGLDVFETEPPAKENPLFSMENVVVAPHNIAWTDELAFGMGRSAFTAIKAISRGEIPQFVVNKEVLESNSFKSKLARWS
ncbi:SerA Phosphoglycerate dehydrogenase and related dehydrogenases [Candidatus Nanopelagicaceae bacterium]